LRLLLDAPVRPAHFSPTVLNATGPDDVPSYSSAVKSYLPKALGALKGVSQITLFPGPSSKDTG
jgi:hypothetical protein